jgi:CheY-specific phosphatase CheX
VRFSHDLVEAATREVLEISAATKIASFDRVHDPKAHVVSLVGTLSLLGTEGGTLVVSCSQGVGAALCAAMLGSDTAEPEETIRDTVGELLNQIAGTLKRKIGASAEALLLSPPVVVSGQPVSHSVKSAAPPIAVVATMDSGTFGVSFWQS